MKKLLVLAAVFFSFSVQAQVGETGGHGKVPRHPGKQQQQQQREIFYKTKIVRGEEAKKKFFEMLTAKSKVTDLRERCGEVSREVSIGWRHHEDKCIEIGAPGLDTTEYVCYLSTNETISGLRAMWFNWTHNQCGLHDPRPVRNSHQ